MTAPRKILVVEDDVIIAADIQETLLRLGYSVARPVGTSDEALRQLEVQKPDMVLMDIQLRGPIDGIATVTRIRAVSDVPVVYLTSHSDEATLSRAKDTGPHGYLVKPFNERDLRTAIEVAIRKHELERHLAERERWFSTTLDSLGEAVIATDSLERITYLNPVAEVITGYSEADAVGRSLHEVFTLVDETGKPVESPVAQAFRKKFAVSLPPKTLLVGKGGQRRSVTDSASPIIDDRGKLLGGVVVFRDITEQKRIEQRLAIAERMASVGTMAAGVAHEINNPLAAMVGNVSFALEQVGELKLAAGTLTGGAGLGGRLSELERALHDTSECAERVRKIIQTMRSFSGFSTLETQLVDLPEVLEPALRLAENAIRHKACIVRVYGTTPFVQVVESQLIQVFTNLLSNAVDAIPDGAAADNEIRVTTFTSDEGHAVVEVHDTGAGISAGVIGHIFEPYFTTKGIGAGMGLGLAISHAIVTGAGGTLTVQSEPDHGATFRVELPPAAPQEPVPVAVVAPREEVRPPGAPVARILVIDDDSAVAGAIRRVLRGHQVVVETEGNSAIARLSAREPFDLILCDLMMPNVTGVDVYQAALAIDPAAAARFVFLTGGAFSPRATEFLASVTNLTMNKPFSPKALRDLAEDSVRPAS